MELPVLTLDNYEPASVDLYFQTQCTFLYTYEFSYFHMVCAFYGKASIL